MKIAIIDNKITGHHLEYIYGLCSKIVESNTGICIDLYCDKYMHKYIEINNLPNIFHLDGLEINSERTNAPKGNWIRKTIISFNNIKKIDHYDHIIFLAVNNYFLALLIYGFLFQKSFSFSGIYFNHFLRGDEVPKRWAKILTLWFLLKIYSKCTILILNDSSAVFELNKKFNTKAFKTLQDPIPKFYYESVSEELKDTGEYTYSLLGSISERKGVFAFLDAIEVSNSNNKFIIAGKVESNITTQLKKKIQLLKERGKNIFFKNEFLSNRNFVRLIRESDIIVIPYLSVGASSGLLGHSAYAKKAVIAPQEGLISQLVKNYKLGITLNPNNTKVFASYLEDVERILTKIDKEQMENYCQHNSLENFYKKLVLSIDNIENDEN